MEVSDELREYLRTAKATIDLGEQAIEVLSARLAQRDALIERLVQQLEQFIQANGHAVNCGPADFDVGTGHAGASMRCRATLELIAEAKAGAP